MDGMFAAASMIELCAIPPVRSASHSANALATGMNVGFGRSGSCSVRSRTRPPRPLRARSAIALSSDCMTSTMIVRSDQPRGFIVRANFSGLRAAAPSSFSGRVSAVPSPVSSVKMLDIASPALAVDDGLDVRVRVGVDRAGDRHAADLGRVLAAA